MADSGTYSPETIARHQKIADTLLLQATKPREIRSRLQGLGQLGESALAGYEGYRADQEEKSAQKEAMATALAAFGGGGAGAAPPGSAAPPTAPNMGNVPAPEQYRPMIESAAATHGLNPETFARQLNQESGFKPNVRSPAGAEGIAQFMPATAREYGVNARDPNSAIPGAAKYMADLTKQFNGNEGHALAAYNWGPGNLQKWLASGGDPARVPAETQNYVKSITGQPLTAAQKVAGALTPGQGGATAPAPTAGPPGGSAAAIAAILNPRTPPAIASALAGQLNPSYGFQTLPDGTILRTNPKSGTVEPIYSAPVKPELKSGGTDPITGQISYQVFDPKTQTMKPVGGPDGAAPAGLPGTQSGMLAKGVTQLDHSLTGDDYLKQFGPEVQAAVKAYMNGDVMPSGNPRLQSLPNTAKTIAQKYGQDMGIPVSDATYSQRRTYRSQLGSNSPSSAGGQAKAFNQGIEHMGHLADTLEKLDNSSGMGIPIVAQVVNAVRQGISTEQSAVSDKAASIGQTLAGEVGKLFSGSAGGGVHERELTRDRFSTVKSPVQLAAALEGTLEMMQGGLTALEQRRNEVMGENSGIRFVNPETEKKISSIRQTIDRLKGSATPAQAAGGVAPGGAPVTKTIGGKNYIQQNGQWFEQ